MKTMITLGDMADKGMTMLGRWRAKTVGNNTKVHHPMVAVALLVAVMVGGTGVQAEPLKTPSSWAPIAKDMFFNCIDMRGVKPQLAHYEMCMEAARKAELECEAKSDPCDGLDRAFDEVFRRGYRAGQQSK
jgi:hypothetical protein